MSAFYDTNILLYADDADAGGKTPVARSLLLRALTERSGVVSTQVLQEYYLNACRKLKLTPASARARVDAYLGLDVVTVTPALLLSAMELHAFDSLSFWDAVVVRNAQHAGCGVLYSEDLQNGRRLGSVRVVNPFA
jgi:predicted nucleic acid-binding protein